MCVYKIKPYNETMKPKPNENLSLPWTPQGEARESEREPSNSLAKRKRNDPTFWLSCIDYLHVFDLADRAVVTDTSPLS